MAKFNIKIINESSPCSYEKAIVYFHGEEIRNHFETSVYLGFKP